MERDWGVGLTRLVVFVFFFSSSVFFISFFEYRNDYKRDVVLTRFLLRQEYIQASNIDFTTSLSACPSVPAHQVGFPKDAYTTSEGIPCYASTTNGNATASQYVSVGYTGLGCSVQGAVVNGNATWVKWLDGSCYFPGDTWDQAEFHGYAVGEC